MSKPSVVRNKRSINNDELPLQIFIVDGSVRPPPMGLLIKGIERSPGQDKSIANNLIVIPRWTGFNIVLYTQAHPSVLTPSTTYLPPMDLPQNYTQWSRCRIIHQVTETFSYMLVFLSKPFVSRQHALHRNTLIHSFDVVRMGDFHKKKLWWTSSPNSHQNSVLKIRAVSWMWNCCRRCHLCSH